MSKPAEILAERLVEHRAVRAWSRLNPERVEPEGIDTLKLKNKSAVYRLGAVAPDGSAVIAKRCRAETAVIERIIHEEFLPGVPTPSLKCYGFVEEPEGQACWLFLEEAIGSEYSPLDAEHRTLAGRWLGMIQTAALRSGLESRLPVRNSLHYLTLLRSSAGTLRQHLTNPALHPDEIELLTILVSHCDMIESHWSEIEETCTQSRQTLVHGDFVSKNVRIRRDSSGLSLLVFDWELAGWGVPATDLCQFTGRTISPDLAAYCEEANGAFSLSDMLEAKRLSECGMIFRLIDDISWATSWLVFDEYKFLAKPMSYLKSYEPRLAEAVRLPGRKR